VKSGGTPWDAKLMTCAEEPNPRQAWQIDKLSKKITPGVSPPKKISKMKSAPIILLKTIAMVCDKMSYANKLLKLNELDNITISL
jgi:hypothetical protein